MNNRLLNKKLISELFENEWYEKELQNHNIKGMVLANTMNIKIAGVKNFITIEVSFIEVDKIGLVLVDLEVIGSPVKIGDVRQAAINAELIARLDQEKYYLPNWVTQNKYILADHFGEYHTYRHNCHTGHYFCIEKAEPELLLEAMADFAMQSDSLERTQLVLHESKIYSRRLANTEMLVSNEEICAYANNHLDQNSSCIVDTKGNVYTIYKTDINDLNNIRLLSKDWRNGRKIAPIDKYSDECYTYREYLALDGQEIDEELPITYSKEYEGAKHSWENGYYQKTPYREKIEIKIFSPRVIGDELIHFKNGDHVQHMDSLEYGIITDSSKENSGLYQFQTEENFKYNTEENMYFNHAHISRLKKVDNPIQENIGRIVIHIIESSYNRTEHVYIGEIVLSMFEYYIIKIPDFSHDIEKNNGTNNTLYQTIPKSNCYYLKQEFHHLYEAFCAQSEQMEWIKNHAVLGLYLYPLLENMNYSTLMPSKESSYIHFEAFMMYLEFHLSIKTPEQIHKKVIEHIRDEATNIMSISLRGMYHIPSGLEDYFKKIPYEE